MPFSLADVVGQAEARASHVGAGLGRGLEPDEEVVLHLADGAFWSATVTGFEFEVDDTLYLFELGVRLPPGDAAVRLGVELADPADELRAVTVHDVLDLVGELRRALVEGGSES